MMGIRLNYELTFKDGTTYEEGLICGDMRDGVIEIMNELYPDDVAYVLQKKLLTSKKLKIFVEHITIGSLMNELKLSMMTVTNYGWKTRFSIWDTWVTTKNLKDGGEWC